MKKQRSTSGTTAFSAEDQLAFMIEMAAFPNEGLSVCLKDPTGCRGRKSAAFIAIKGQPAIYAPTIEAAIDKAIMRKRLLEKHARELKQIGVSG